jgi:hypothetical protein
MSKNLPATLTDSYSTYSYEYTLDGDGYPTQIIVTDNGSQEKIYITYY